MRKKILIKTLFSVFWYNSDWYSRPPTILFSTKPSRRHIVLLVWIETSCLQINWQYCVRACLWRWHGVCGHYCDPAPRPGTSVSVNSNWWPAKEKLKAPGWWLGGRVGPCARVWTSQLQRARIHQCESEKGTNDFCQDLINLNISLDS